jgi:hypothetical protein
MSQTKAQLIGGVGLSTAANLTITNFTLSGVGTVGVGASFLNSSGIPFAAFAAGTTMIFQQTSSPTGWTKNTTHDNKALRIVNGTVGSGGNVGFTTAFASRTITGNVDISNAAVTLTTTQMPAHTHTAALVSSIQNLDGGANANLYSGNTYSTGSAGSSGSHTHSNTATFTADSANFAVQYVDVIIASKD